MDFGVRLLKWGISKNVMFFIVLLSVRDWRMRRINNINKIGMIIVLICLIFFWIFLVIIKIVSIININWVVSVCIGFWIIEVKRVLYCVWESLDSEFDVVFMIYSKIYFLIIL